MPSLKQCIGVLGLSALLGLVWTQGGTELFGIQQAAAQGTGIPDDAISALAQLVGFLNVALSVGAWVAFYYLTALLDPTFIFGGGAGGAPDSSLLNMLHEIWQLSRDLVNLVFALLLIVGAIMTIVTAKTEMVKQYLSKFVIAVVLVNFSWFIPRVVYDISQVAAYTVFQLPNLLSVGPCFVPGAPGQPPQPCVVVDDVRLLEHTRDADVKPGVPGTGWTCPLPDLVCIHQIDMNVAAASISAETRVLNGLIINFARLSQLDAVSDPRMGGGFAAGDGLDRTSMIITYLIKLVLILAIRIALFFPLLALMVAFFIRIPVLWITMAFMPFVALGYVIGDKLGGMNEWIQKIQSSFISAAFLPAIVGIPLAIGFIMINAGMVMAPPASWSGRVGIPLFAGVDTYWQLLWLMIALFVLWKGTFDALSKHEFAAKFTEKIKEQGQTLGQLAFRTPLSIPFIPIGKPGDPEGRKSIGQLLRMPRQAADQMAHFGTLPSARAALGAPSAAAMQAFEQRIRTANLQSNVTIKGHVDHIIRSSDATQVRTRLEELRRDLQRQGMHYQPGEEQALLSALGRTQGKNQNEIDNLLRKARENPPAAHP